MRLNDNSKKLAHEVFDAIEKEKQKAYMKGYTAGVESMFDRAKNWRDSMVRLKDAPSAMDTMPVAPNPCVKNMAWKTVKDFFQKLNEECDEFKQEVLRNGELDDDVRDVKNVLDSYDDLDFPATVKDKRRIAEEAADVCTVLASLCEALGIGYDIRMEEQAHVNRNNHERGRN